MSINNFEIINSLLDFNNDKTFYHITILKRRKDNPEMETGVKVVDNYYLYKPYDLLKLQDRIINNCKDKNARAYINLNRLDTEKIALYTMKIITDYIINQQYVQVKNAYSMACGSHHSEENKRWIVDIDLIDPVTKEAIPDMSDKYNAIMYFINKEHNEMNNKNAGVSPNWRSIIAEIPTKHGTHIITNPFNLKLFGDKFPGIDVNKNSPTILYIP